MGKHRTRLLFLLPMCILLLAGCANQNYESRPFYQHQIGTEWHGRKTMFDRIVETDPGGLHVEMAKDYEEHAPATIAILPFTDRGSAQYVVDKIPLTFRNRQERMNWAWTDSQRLRRAFVAYFSEREFIVVNPIGIDAVLKSHNIDNEEQLEQVSVLKLGEWFHCDAVVYGTVEDYDAYYFGLVAGFVVGVDARMVSTHDGETLMRGQGARYSMNVIPALDVEDILINSAENLLQLRDIELARAEEEVARELVIRIPPSETLKDQIARNAIRKARAAEEAEEEAMTAYPPIIAATTPYLAPPPSANEVQFLDAVALGDHPASEQQVVDEGSRHLNTASSWQRPGIQRSVYLSSQSPR
jgi:hypothetical protein